MVEISKAFEYPDFDVFDRVRFPKDLRFVGMMQYDGDLLLPKVFLVPPPEIKGVSGEYLVKNGITTFACSEVRAGVVVGGCSVGWLQGCSREWMRASIGSIEAGPNQST